MKQEFEEVKENLFGTRIYLERYSESYKDAKELVERFPRESSLAEGNWAQPTWFWRDKWNLDRYFIQSLAESCYYRPLLQSKSVDEWLAWLDAEIPALRDLVRLGIMRKHLEACKQHLGNYMVVRVPWSTTLTFKGITYRGIGDIARADKEGGQVYSIRKLFPCFDSYDYANENRFYRNYWFGVDEVARVVIRSLKSSAGYCYIGEDLPDVALPMVYYEDEQETMLVAYKGANPFGL